MTSKRICAAMAIAASLAFSTPALAGGNPQNVSTQTVALTKTGPGAYSAIFDMMPGAGTFLNTFLFAIPQTGKVSVRIESTQTGGPPTNVNFNATNVKFDGVKLANVSRGVFELRTLVDTTVNQGISNLVVEGAAGAAGVYTGTVTYAIPEPAMWALMILGFGFTGAALRTRRRQVTFAAA